MPQKRFILKKQSTGEEMVLTGNLTVGRANDCGLRLTEGRPSREHALLSLADGSVFVEDLGSTNGTYVNDERIHSRVKLKSNDQLRFDLEQYQFRIDWEEQRDATVLRTGAPDQVAPGGLGRVPEHWVEEPRAQNNKTLYFGREARREEQKLIAAEGNVDDAFSAVEVPQLVVLRKNEKPLRIELRTAGSAQREWTVGSEGERDVLLSSPGVSALHAKILFQAGRWKVIDQLSSNGTAVNGTLCTASALNAGDRISFGPVECIFQLPGASTGSTLRRVTGETRARALMTRGALVTCAVLLALVGLLAAGFIYRGTLLPWVNGIIEGRTAASQH